MMDIPARSLSPPALIAVLLTAVLLSLSTLGCNISEPATPTQGQECEDEGATEAGFVCTDGVWVIEDNRDAGYGDTDDIDDGEDADAGPCEPESTEEFCLRHDDECGQVIGNDNCGDARGVDCSEVDDIGCTDPEVCVLADDDDDFDINTCQCPVVDDPDDICELIGADCGTITPGDVCADWDEFEDVECGGCPDEDADCGTDIPNVCGCPCEIDGTCYADGAQQPDTQCSICDPAQSDSEFSDASDGTECDTDITGAEASCDSGDCLPACEDDELTLCDNEGLCADLETDAGHCGSCGNECGSDESCVDGDCVCDESRSDSQVCSDEGADCGTVYDICGNSVSCASCGSGEQCDGNTCVECTSDGDCSGCQTCSSTGSCVDDDSECTGSQEVCDDAQCICVPDCSGKECGDDGCGGSCGACGGAINCTYCTTSGTCESTCSLNEQCCGENGCYPSGDDCPDPV